MTQTELLPSIDLDRLADRSTARLTPNQSKIWSGMFGPGEYVPGVGAKFNVAVCGAGFGKSFLGIKAARHVAAQPGLLVWYVGPTYKMAKDIFWEPLIRDLSELGWIKNKNTQDMSVTVHSGSQIQVRSADRPDNLRGVRPHFLILDEYAQMPKHIWTEILLPRALDKVLFIGTPKGRNHFYRMYREAAEGHKSALWRAWKFTSLDGGLIPQERLEEMRRAMSDEEWRQEIMAEFVDFSGEVYGEFSRNIHVVDPFKIPDDWTMIGAVDVGFNDPTCFLWLAQEPRTNRVYIVKEHYERRMRPDQHAPYLYVKSEEFGGLDRLDRIWCDKGATQHHGGTNNAIESFDDHGVYLIESPYAQRDSVVPGVMRVKRALCPSPKDGKPLLQVFSTCKNTIYEFENYMWDSSRASDQGERNSPEKPKDNHNHAMDCVRMAVCDLIEDRFATALAPKRADPPQFYGDGAYHAAPYLEPAAMDYEEVGARSSETPDFAWIKR